MFFCYLQFCKTKQTRFWVFGAFAPKSPAIKVFQRGLHAKTPDFRGSQFPTSLKNRVLLKNRGLEITRNQHQQPPTLQPSLAYPPHQTPTPHNPTPTTHPPPEQSESPQKAEAEHPSATPPSHPNTPSPSPNPPTAPSPTSPAPPTPHTPPASPPQTTHHQPQTHPSTIETPATPTTTTTQPADPTPNPPQPHQPHPPTNEADSPSTQTPTPPTTQTAPQQTEDEQAQNHPYTQDTRPKAYTIFQKRGTLYIPQARAWGRVPPLGGYLRACHARVRPASLARFCRAKICTWTEQALSIGPFLIGFSWWCAGMVPKAGSGDRAESSPGLRRRLT